MAQRAIREYDAKRILGRHWQTYWPDLAPYHGHLIQVSPETELAGLPGQHPWLEQIPLAVKPDVLAGKRGKHGLVLLDADWPAAQRWLAARLGTTVEISGVSGELSHFLIEPFVRPGREYYLSLRTEEDADLLLFSAAGGVEIEANWDRVASWRIPAWPRQDPRPGGPWPAEIQAGIAAIAPAGDFDVLWRFITGLWRLFRDLHFAQLEINPLTVVGGGAIPLDLKARIDDTAAFECGTAWGDLAWPPHFGRSALPAERRIAELDAHSGASLKLAVLNPAGSVWTMVAGGGASVIYTDTIADLGFAAELANYGEYSGNPSTAETYEYAREILGLVTASPAAPGKAKSLIIGGGIANFTDVAETFSGIISAMHDYAGALRATPVRIYVRRGGPNYEEGLRRIAQAGREIGVPVQVFGPEAHMTRIVALALADARKEVGQ